MDTVYCSACGEAMSAAAVACPKCGQPNGSLSASKTSPLTRGLQGPALSTVRAQTSFGDAIKLFLENMQISPVVPDAVNTGLPTFSR